MSLEDLGNIGDFVAAVGVIVSLIYLAAQIKQNTRQMKQNAESLTMAHELTGAELAVEGFLTIAKEKELGDIYKRGLYDFNGLSDEEKFRFAYLLFAIFYINQAGFHNYRLGLADPEAWAGHESLYKEILGNAGVKNWWEHQEHLFSEPYRQYISNLLCEDGEAH